jgi:hypothetical protein
VIFCKEVVDDGQNAEHEDNHEEQVAGIDERLSFKTLFQKSQVHHNVNDQGDDSNGKQNGRHSFFVWPDYK